MKDVQQRIHNALTILEDKQSREPHQAARSIGLAVEALRAAKQGLVEGEEVLALVSEPDLQAAREVQRLRKELALLQEKAARLERELAGARSELEIEKRVQGEERRRLAELEAKVKKFDSLLLTNDQAFDRFMQGELDRKDKKPKR